VEKRDGSNFANALDLSRFFVSKITSRNNLSAGTGQSPGRLFVDINPRKVHATLNKSLLGQRPYAIAGRQWG
jgi:hypothetical protein